MEAKDNMLTNKDGEILRLLNQIASDMVKRSDVDEIVKGAVAEEHDRMVAFYVLLSDKTDGLSKISC